VVDPRQYLVVFVLALVVFAVVVMILLVPPAYADHCTGDQSHLSNDECGYWMEPVPVVSPTPYEVKVVNTPEVNVANTPHVEFDRPVPVVEQSPVSPAEPAEGDGWGNEDRNELKSFRLQVVLALGLGLFAVAGLLVTSLPKVGS
jgi:hypothetical protein